MRFRAAVFSLVLITSSCAGVQPERKVEDNVFASSRSPKITLRIDPSFEYLGTWKDSSSRGSFCDVRRSHYVFAHAKQQEVVDRIVHVYFSELSASALGGWASNLFRETDRTRLARGETDILGKRYQFAVRAHPSVFSELIDSVLAARGHLSPESATDRILAEKGYRSPECAMHMLLGRVILPNAHVMLMVRFAVDIVDIKLDGKTFECESWEFKRPCPPGRKNSLTSLLPISSLQSKSLCMTRQRRNMSRFLLS